MSLFEWFGESYNPGPIGGVETAPKNRPDRSRWAVLVCFAITIIVLAFFAHLITRHFPNLDLGDWGLILLCATLYMALGYLIHPKPDMSNIGWLGGLMDHPFRYSDDLNRFLLFLTVVLLPGRFFAESIVDGTILIFKAGRRQARPRPKR